MRINWCTFYHREGPHFILKKWYKSFANICLGSAMPTTKFNIEKFKRNMSFTMWQIRWKQSWRNTVYRKRFWERIIQQTKLINRIRWERTHKFTRKPTSTGEGEEKNLLIIRKGTRTREDNHSNLLIQIHPMCSQNFLYDTP